MAAGAAILGAAMLVAALTAAAKTAMTPKPEDEDSLSHYAGGFLQNFFKALPFATIGSGVSAAGQTPAHWTDAAGEPIGPYGAAGAGAGAAGTGATSGAAASGALSEGARSAALESAMQSPEGAQLLGDIDVVTEMPVGQYYGYTTDYGTYKPPMEAFELSDLGDWDWWTGDTNKSLFRSLGVERDLGRGAMKGVELGYTKTPGDYPEYPVNYYMTEQAKWGGRLPSRKQSYQQFWNEYQRDLERRMREGREEGQLGVGLYGGYGYGR